jgi:hypothetical protein
MLRVLNSPSTIPLDLTPNLNTLHLSKSTRDNLSNYQARSSPGPAPCTHSSVNDPTARPAPGAPDSGIESTACTTLGFPSSETEPTACPSARPSSSHSIEPVPIPSLGRPPRPPVQSPTLQINAASNSLLSRAVVPITARPFNQAAHRVTPLKSYLHVQKPQAPISVQSPLPPIECPSHRRKECREPLRRKNCLRYGHSSESCRSRPSAAKPSSVINHSLLTTVSVFIQGYGVQRGPSP